MMFLWIVIIGVLLYFFFGGELRGINSKQDIYSQLDERLAKGEIDIEEYQDIIKTLKENRK